MELVYILWSCPSLGRFNRHPSTFSTFVSFQRQRQVLINQPGDPQSWPRQNFIFFYGYLVGNETFVGNWRFAALDPNVPTWESAFVMSRRKDDEDE